MDREIFEKVKSAETVEEIIEISKANNKEISEETAKHIFENLHHKGELSDDELDNVSGGGCSSGSNEYVPPQGPNYYPGQKVYLCNTGHTFGSKFCDNRACRSSVFTIIKQIDDSGKFLIGCVNCDWTYHAYKENMICV